MFLKQSSTAYAIDFLMVSSTDHVTGVTGLSPTVTISKNGGSFASPTGTVAEIGNGWYKLTPSATDVATLGLLALHATGTGADPVDALYLVVGYDPYSATNLGLSALPTANPAASGGLPTVGTGSGQINPTGGKVPATLAAGDLATDSITAAALKPDAVTEIQTGLASQSSVDTLIGYVDTEVAAIKTQTDKIPNNPAAIGSAMTLDLTQTVPTSNTAQTVGDALNAARAQGFGKWVKNGTTLTLYANDGTTVVRTFTLDDADAPNSRT